MKCLKEPLARLANQQDRGERRNSSRGGSKAFAILDEGSLLATCAYIDLNPVAAGIARAVARSQRAHVDQRAAWITWRRRRPQRGPEGGGETSSAAASKQAAGLEEKLWLCPASRTGASRIDSTRGGDDRRVRG